jgi:DNA-binding transcriptional ArsR family regulator
MIKKPVKSNLGEFEQLFLALADKTRLRLLTLMADEPVSVGFLVDKLGESQPKVSRHLAYLRNAAVVNTRRDGKWIYYGIQQSDDPDINRVIRFVIDTLLGAAVDEPSHSSRSRYSQTQTAVAAGKADKAKIGRVDHQEQDETFDLETGEVEYVYQFEDEEAFAETEVDKDELDVFLL